MIHEADRPRKPAIAFENSKKIAPLTKEKILFPYRAFLRREE
jgi:hypothetical protein